MISLRHLQHHHYYYSPRALQLQIGPPSCRGCPLSSQADIFACVYEYNALRVHMIINLDLL